MSRLLEKIGWRMRKARFGFSPFYLNIQTTNVELVLLNVQINLRQYTLFMLDFSFPNKTNVQKFTLHSWDLFFVREFLVNRAMELEEKSLWTLDKLPYIERVTLNILNKIL